jgi:chemotaxis signal transduction protein
VRPMESPVEGQKVPVLLFLSGGRRYGVRLSKVREVVEIGARESIEGEVGDYIGVMVLRDEPIPLVAVGQVPAENSESDLPICIVLQSGHAVVGLAVERILGIRQFKPERPMKGLMSNDRPQYAYLDDEGRLVQAVDTDRWFNAQPGLPLLSDQRSSRPLAERPDAVDEARPTYMALTVGDRYFAVDSTLVERAIDDIRVALLPRRPGVRIDSVIEVSGNVLPVLRLSEGGFESQSIYIIVNFYDHKWAVATERVLGIVSNESPPRPVGDDAQERVISHKGAFHEVIDLKGLIAAQVPDFIRPDGQRA